MNPRSETDKGIRFIYKRNHRLAALCCGLDGFAPYRERLSLAVVFLTVQQALCGSVVGMLATFLWRENTRRELKKEAL